MPDSAPNTYDEVPYASFAFPQSHPDRLATIATLLGLQPPRVESARVLELGCAAGGNLIPMAESLENAAFLGVDLSERQIADGCQLIDQLGLTNIRLQRANILELGPDLGTFDYILCHGVFSWVPRDVQEKILSLCQTILAPNGIAYISYNTLPGWRMRGMIRDMMLYHAQQFDSPKEKVEQGLALLDFLAQAAAGDQSPFAMFLRSEVQLLRQHSQTYIFHEHLEQTNEPCYFHEFAARAAEHGLRYLGEAELPVMVPANFPPAVQQVLDRLSADLIHLEQYMDFLRNRTFRQTLLCQRQLEPAYRIGPERLGELFVASPARPASAQPALRSASPEVFHLPNGLTITARDAIVKAAFVVLAEAWPRAMPFGRLRMLARERLSPGPVQDAATAAQDAKLLGQTLLQFYATASAAAVELSVRPPAVSAQPGERPVARRLARVQAGRGSSVTNLRHQTVTLGEFERQVLLRLDGTRDRSALVSELADLVRDGTLTVQKDGEPVAEGVALRNVLSHALEQQLGELARQSLLAA